MLNLCEYIKFLNKIKLIFRVFEECCYVGICCDANMRRRLHPRTGVDKMLAGGRGPGDWRHISSAPYILSPGPPRMRDQYSTLSTLHSGKLSPTKCASALVETLGETGPQVLSSCCRSNFAVCLQLACFAYSFGHKKCIGC